MGTGMSLLGTYCLLARCDLSMWLVVLVLPCAFFLPRFLISTLYTFSLLSILLSVSLFYEGLYDITDDIEDYD